MKVCVEKVGQSSAEIHIANALAVHNRHISIEAGTLELLKPGGRKKVDRIIENLQWPLNNNKWFYSTSIPAHHTTRLKDEMDKFPVWHDDGLDICAYLYDVVKQYKFGMKSSSFTKPLPRRHMGVR